MSTYVTCAACAEENKVGATRCARCGAALDDANDAQMDPELVNFEVAQAEMAEKNRQEHRDRILKDIASTGWGFIGRR